MAYELIKVSELPELTTPSDPNVLPIQDGDYLKRISFENLKDAAVGDMEGSLAAAYDSTATYAVGDYCIYEGQLYRCTTAITTAEAWTAGHWTAAVLTDDIASDLSTEASTRSTNDNALAADIAEALGDLAAVYSTSATYAVGDYCIYQGQLYRCTTAITTAEAWTSGHWAAVALGNDTRGLRSALTTDEDEIFDINNNLTLVSDFVDGVTNREKIGVALSFENATGFWTRNKTFALYDTYQVRSVSISVNRGEEYLVTSNSYYEMARIAFFDSDNNIVSILWSSNNNALQTDTYVKIPKGVSTMLIQAVGNAYTNAVLTKIGDYITSVNDSAVVHGHIALDDIVSDNFVPSYSEVTDLAFTDKTGYYDKNGGFSTYSNVKGATVNVAEGEKYLLTSKSFYSMARAVFFNSSNAFVSSVYSSNDATLHENTEITVPATATTMLIQRVGSNIVELKKNTSMQINSTLAGKHVTVIGDSITEHNWRATTNWAMYIAEWSGAYIQNLGYSGTGFAKATPYINRISNIQANPDLIGVALSWNDMSAGLPVGDVTDTGTSSLCGYANDFFDALITAFPNVPVICYVQNVWSAYKYGVTASDNWFNKLKEICALKSVPFYGDMYLGSVLRPWNAINKTTYFTSDGEGHESTENAEHPNSAGHKAIARYLYPKFAENVVG